MNDDVELNISLGLQPVSNRFLASSMETAPCYPMNFSWNSDFGCMVLNTPFPVEEIRPRYDWISCFEPEEHLDEMVNDIISVCHMTPETRVVGYSFKDDTTLDRLSNLGFKNIWRINPIRDLKITEPLASIETLQQAFSSENIKHLVNLNGKSDIVIARHVIEHAYDLENYIHGLTKIINPSGYIIFELPDCERAMRAGDCTVLWEEHLTYFTTKSFRNLMLKYGFEIIFEATYEYPLENSITMVVRKAKFNSEPPPSHSEDKSIFSLFKTKIETRTSKIKKVLNQHKKDGKKIAIFGAGHLSIAFLSFHNLTGLVDVCLDDNPHKKGMYLPIGGVPIIGSEQLDASVYPLCLLGLNPQHHHTIRKKFQNYLGQGGQMPSIFPETQQYLGDNL